MIKRTTVIAVGINNYQFLKKLNGPLKDVDCLEKLLCLNTDTALFTESFIKLTDITVEELRKEITKYAVNRTASNDILIFYFSGHATLIGNKDLGLCLKDSQYHQEYNASIPLSVVRFSDLVETLASVKVDPKELTVEELQPLGSTIHTTYSKLSYKPAWGLLEKLGRGKAKLTEKGIKFINGEISIPYSISKDINTDDYIPTENTTYIFYNY